MKFKSIAFVLFSFILVLSFFSCAAYHYEGTDISSIDYTVIDYNGCYTRETIVDLVNGQVLNREYYPYDDEIEEYSVDRQFETDTTSEFLDEIGKAGLFDLEDNYPPSGIIADGGGWTLAIVYADGTEKISSGDNNFPTRVFQKADYAFFALYGDDLFGTLPSSYKNPPCIDLSFHYPGHSEGFSGVSAVNYTWHEACIDNIDVIAYGNQNHMYEFNSSYEYQFVLWTTNYDYRFSRMIIKSYDLDGEDEKEIDDSGWFQQKEYDLEFNRIYVIEMTFTYGTCQYVFSSIIDE